MECHEKVNLKLISKRDGKREVQKGKLDDEELWEESIWPLYTRRQREQQVDDKKWEIFGHVYDTFLI